MMIAGLSALSLFMAGCKGIVADDADDARLDSGIAEDLGHLLIILMLAPLS